MCCFDFLFAVSHKRTKQRKKENLHTPFLFGTMPSFCSTSTPLPLPDLLQCTECGASVERLWRVYGAATKLETCVSLIPHIHILYVCCLCSAV